MSLGVNNVTIRKMWLIVLILTSILTVGINALILTTLTDQYFTDYLEDSYNTHIEHILDYTKTALTDQDISYKQMNIELESHLNDPIIKIKVYNAKGDLLVDVDSDYHVMGNMHHGSMGSRMMGHMMRDSSNEVIQYEVVDGGKVIGILNVTLHSVAEKSFVAREFKASLLNNSIYAILISIAISIVIGFLMSKKMTSSLKDTAKIASNIQLGEMTWVKDTSIREVNAIRESLEELESRLRLKQKSRQVLVDELVHQTRTPLTILRSHLEAIEDGLVEFNQEKIKMFQNQIENITLIISNMSSLIDASKETDIIRAEQFEINQMLKQMIVGLKAQFTKKNITLELLPNDKLKIYTDKNKLSQSIYNILTNAYKYTNKNDHVQVSFIHLKDKVIIKVEDTGIGIAESEIHKIFNAYYRSPQATHIEGDGIGLYIVKDNIEKIGGNISVTSKPGVGSTFIIEIPTYYK